MTDLIQELINRMRPAYKKLIIIAADGAFYKNERTTTSSMEQVVESRMHGDRKPVVIYGFYRLERIKRRQYGSLLSEAGIFYLQLPARLEQVYAILDKALIYKEDNQGKIILQGAERVYALEKIRAFKHRCDNLWMSMQSDLSIQIAAPQKKEPVAIDQFLQLSYVERFAKEYEEDMNNIATQVGLKKASQIPKLFSGLIKITNKYKKSSLLPVTKETLIDLSACIKKIKTISEILSAAKEMAGHV